MMWFRGQASINNQINFDAKHAKEVSLFIFVLMLFIMAMDSSVSSVFVVNKAGIN